VMTDNKNRISSEMRIATNKKGGTVANPGSVTFNFDRKGVIQVLKINALEDELFLAASEVGAEDFDSTEDAFMITTPPDQLIQIKEKLDQLGIKCEEAELRMIPKLYIDCDLEAQKLNFELIDYLEALDDVDAVYHNMKLE
jgi:YebC/PmpR family DNA-binding regulatory protein